MQSNTLSYGSILHGNQYNYIIEKVLGQGAFGITYLAKVSLQGQLGQLDSNVFVTIKEFFMKEINGREGTNVTSSSSSKGGLFYYYKEKFAREAKNLSKLKHPNIVNVMDYFEANNTCYYVMEYLSGGDLDTLIEKRRGLGEEDTIRFTKQIGSALSFMHQNKMLHLDLKPKNVMLNADGNAILIDFGLSKQYDSSGEPESSTTVGRGTPGYAPLEQANYQDGHGFPVTMDVYALGATMYKMLTGVRAPEASVILNEGFPIDNINKTCTSRLLNGIIKAMSPLKKDRFQSIEEILNDLNLDIVEHVEKEKQIKFIFMENGEIVPLHRIQPRIIFDNGSCIFIHDDNFVFWGDEIYANKIIESTNKYYTIRPECSKLDITRLKDGSDYLITVESCTPLNMTFNTPWNKPKEVILQRKDGQRIVLNVTDELNTQLPGKFEEYSFTIDSKYYEKVEGHLPPAGTPLRINMRAKIASKVVSESTDHDESQRATKGLTLWNLIIKKLCEMDRSTRLDKLSSNSTLRSLLKNHIKKIIILLICVFLIVSVIGIYIYRSSIQQGNNDSEGKDSINIVNNNQNKDPEDIFNGHEYVDLALPSGTLWATCNIGAKHDKYYGDFFAWGETKSYNYMDALNSSWESYKYCNDSEKEMTKYCTSLKYGVLDNKVELELEDDAAHILWGGAWRIPSSDQLFELMDSNNCTWKWEENYYLITSKRNGNSIKLIYTYFDEESKDVKGFYWTRSLHLADGGNSCADGLYFTNSFISKDGHWFTRKGRLCIRPVVCPK